MLIIFLLLITIPFLTAYNIVLTGNFTYWNDPARDIIQATSEKFTLIGPPSGIPGIFYGPYWIWALKMASKISLDPRIITFIVALLPYIVIFPFILWQFRNIMNKTIVVYLWVLFVLSSFYTYATNLWNINPAPLIFLAFVYVLTRGNGLSIMQAFFSGVLAGLLVNFTVSFGVGTVAGAYLFFLIYSLFSFFKNKQVNWKYVLSLIIFSLGIFICFIPFALFEYRHQFLQTHAILKTFQTAFYLHAAIVGQKGLSTWGIIKQFGIVVEQLLHISDIILIILLTLYLGWGIWFWRKHFSAKDINLASSTTKLILLLVSILFSVCFIYIFNKNPIWGYHYIGVDVIFLLLIGIIAKYSKKTFIILSIWTVLLIFMSIPSYIHDLSKWGKIDHSLSSFATKELVIDAITKDAQNKNYKIFVYNPAIYIYDYDYLVRWKTHQQAYFQPQDPSSFSIAYIIFPKMKESLKNSYIDYITPNTVFKTTKILYMGDGITIVQRVHSS